MDIQDAHCRCGGSLLECSVCGSAVCVNLGGPGPHNFTHGQSCTLSRTSSTSRRPVRQVKPPSRLGEQYEEEINKIREKSREGRKRRDNRRSVTKECPEEEKSKKKDKKRKRNPQTPSGETERQIEFFEKFALQREDCTCYHHEDDEEESKESPKKKRRKINKDPWVDSSYNSLEEAIEAVKALIRRAKSSSQQCNAFSILKKGDRFLVLVTNSSHTQASEKKTEETIEETKILTIRPIKEPELSEQISGSTNFGYFYAIKSCEVCDIEGFTNSLLITPETDFDELVADDKFLCKEFPSEINRLGLKVKIQNIASHYGNHCRIIFIKKIQTNEKKNAYVKTQDGWSLHHSELEALYNALRHGWEIVAMFIDRDCCVTCGSTLGRFAKKVHALIKFFDDID